MALGPHKEDPNYEAEMERKKREPATFADFRMQEEVDAKELGKAKKEDDLKAKK